MATLGDRYILGSGRSDHDRLHVISEIHAIRSGDLRQFSITLLGIRIAVLILAISEYSGSFCSVCHVLAGCERMTGKREVIPR